MPPSAPFFSGAPRLGGAMAADLLGAFGEKPRVWGEASLKRDKPPQLRSAENTKNTVCGAFAALGAVLVFGPATTANPRWPRGSIHSIHSIHRLSLPAFTSALQAFFTCAVRGNDNRSRVFLSPRPPCFSAGRPDLRVKLPQTFLTREGLRPAFGEKPPFLITASASASLRLIRYLRMLVATSPAATVGPRPAMTTSPVRDLRLLRARRQAPSQGRPCRWFRHAPASGIYNPRSVHAACASQRFARRPATGPAVMQSACGAFAALT